MQNKFNSPEVTAKIKEFEEQTGYELVVAATQSSDPYPGALWRGGLLLGLLFSAIILHYYAFEPRSLEVLLIGAVVLFTVGLLKLTALHRFFVLPSEAERETFEKAGQLFSQFQSQTLGHQAAIMLFISLDEHKMHLLVDRDLQTKLTAQDLHETLALLRSDFGKGEFAVGVVKAAELLKQTVLKKAGKNSNPPELSISDRVFWF